MNSTIDELPVFTEKVESNVRGEELIQLFNNKKELPGILIQSSDDKISLISRRFFFERMGKMFGTEIFLNRPVNVMLDFKSSSTLRIPSTTKISHAANLILNRNETEVFEPIIVEKKTNEFGVIAPLTIFMAQNAILAKVHNHQLTVNLQSLNLSDIEALSILNSFINPEESFKLSQVQQKHRIYCTSCCCLSRYSVADVIRDYPDVSKGIRLENRRGRLVLVMKVKHQCSDALWEIEVEHHTDLSFQKQHAVQLLESYII